MIRRAALRWSQGSWIPWLFVGAFLIVVAANGVLILFASRSWSGLETEGAYEKGLAYNETLAAADRQDALGWRVDTAIESLAARRIRVTLDLRDRSALPLTAASVDLLFRRPTHSGQDRTVALAEMDPGRYRAEIDLPLAGQWDMLVQATLGDHRFAARRRIQVR